VLETIGYEPRMARWARAGDASLGRVVRGDRGLVSVLTRTGTRRASIGGGLLARMAADPFEEPCVGDWCVLRAWPDHRDTVERVLPRRTTLLPAAPRGSGRRPGVLCSNLDLCAVVIAALPAPTPGDLEALVGTARGSGASPLLVVTGPPADEHPDRLAADLRADLPTGLDDLDVLAVGTRTRHGVDALRDRLDGRLTLALLGPPGQGRSALAAALVGAEPLGPRRGRRSRLVPLPGGGAVIDVYPPTRDHAARSAG
jgi:ribosome biogenesis GTPase / thiamine phosphate phosphatase